MMLVGSLALAGCASTSAVPVVARGEAFIPVHDVPAERDEPTMTGAERARMSASLLAARSEVGRRMAAAAKVDAERDEAERRVAEKRRIEAEARPADPE
jgi:hypothetical protein